MDNFRFSTTAFTTFLTTIRENQSDSKQKSLFIGEHAMHWLETRLYTHKLQSSLNAVVHSPIQTSKSNFAGKLLAVLTFVLVRHALYPLKNTLVCITYFLLILSYLLAFLLLHLRQIPFRLSSHAVHPMWFPLLLGLLTGQR